MFYSQVLSKTRIDNVCAKCEAKFSSWGEYYKHVTLVKCAKQIKPINTSGRTKNQIVQAWELKNKENIIQ